MKSLDELYRKEGPTAAPTAAGPAEASVEKAPTSSAASAPILETPPGLPQEYIDINLKNQPLPPVMDPSQVSAMEEKPKNTRRILGGESLCNATDIPYTPGSTPEIIKDRIAQGPRVFPSRAARERFDKGLDEKVEEKRPQGPTLAHPDTLRPGTFITGESPAYRPG